MRAARRRRERAARNGTTDVGATLTELLIGIVLLGIIMTALTSAVVVIVKQRAGTAGRLNNARAEQNLNMWLPADLTSAEQIDTTAGASPCGNACPASADTRGSNAVMFTWTTMQASGAVVQPSTIKVSYRYMAVNGEYRLTRVSCTSVASGPWSCTSTIVLRNLPAPPTGSFRPGIDRPTWMFDVQQPLDAAATSNAAAPIDPTLNVKNATRIVVTIDGGGSSAGGGGGQSTMTFTAGGTERKTIDADSVEGAPSFTEARTRCGGNYGLVIDYSGSIGNDFNNVKNGVKAFVDAFAGTPIKIQATVFWGSARTLGAGNTAANWFRWFDMLKPADVAALKAAVDSYGMGGGTNWEEGFFRMFKDFNGAWAATQPDTVLFFTDGQPNTYRTTSARTDGAPVNPPTFTGNGITGAEMSWLRANFIADSIRPSTRLIGVGVGDIVSQTTSFRFGTSGTRTTIPNWKTIERLVVGSGSSVQAQWDGSKYTNAEVANMYLMPDYSKFAKALQGVALAECGGTLTLQTMANGTPASVPFTYQNTRIVNAAGATVASPLTIVTTTSSYPSGTFDFEVPNGQYVDVTVEPQLTSALSGFTPAGWSCTAGASARSVTAVPITNSPWSGITVRVGSNEAVSCVMNVVPV